MNHSATESTKYYVPHGSPWPLLGSLGLLITLAGFANWLHLRWFGAYMFFTGALILVIMMFGWFGSVIRENQRGLYNTQVDRSFRWAMGWFIFSEVLFFGAFFGALFYARLWVIPLLGGEYTQLIGAHISLWPDFSASWPLLRNPDDTQFAGAGGTIPAFGIPLLNTLILLTSGATITWAHWALKFNKRKQLITGLALTIALGMVFLFLQAHEYIEAYEHFNLTLQSGIYGSTFFMLTGFHGAHVTIGTIMLIVILLRSMVGHFSKHHHFAFEAAAWYWHFVDVVWLFLFILVYWL